MIWCKNGCHRFSHHHIIISIEFTTFSFWSTYTLFLSFALFFLLMNDWMNLLYLYLLTHPCACFIWTALQCICFHCKLTLMLCTHAVSFHLQSYHSCCSYSWSEQIKRRTFETTQKKNDGKQNAFDKWKENEMAPRQQRYHG